MKDSRFSQFGEIRESTEGRAHCSGVEKGRSERVEGAQVSQWLPREPVCR